MPRRSRRRTRQAIAPACATLWERDIEEARRVYGKNGDLHWQGSTPVSVDDFCKLAKKAIPGSYNEFDAERVCRVLRTEPNVCVVLGREYSPAVYVTGSPKALANLKRKAKAMRADEADFVPRRLRLWWD